MKFFKSKNCPSCPQAEKNLKQAMDIVKLNEVLEIYDISTDDGRIEALNNMVLSSPALIAGEKTLAKDVLLDREKLIMELKSI